MSSRKKKHEKELKRKRKKQEREQRFRESHPFADAKVVYEPAGAEKMSEVLMEFIEPYEATADTPEKLERLLSISVIAWNAGLASGPRRDKLLQDSLQMLPPNVQQELRAFFAVMIPRKETTFASITRFILDYQLTMTPSGPHLSVISTFTPP